MRAIVFDINDTLLHAREHVFRQLEQLTLEFDGVPAPRREIAEALSGNIDEMLLKLVKNSQADFGKVRERHEELRQQAIQQIELADGVADLLPILRRLGWRLAAVAAGDYPLVEVLEQANVHQFFDAIITDEHSSLSKPHPSAILYSLQQLGVTPDQAVVVGDQPADIAAGRSAGAGKTVGLIHGFDTPTALRGRGADHIIANIPALLDVIE